MATEPFALHNLGSDTLLIIRDTRCCHATMVNVKGPFTSVMAQKAGVAYGEPNLPRTPLGPHHFLNKWEKSMWPFFSFTERSSWGLQKAKQGPNSTWIMHSHSTRALAPAPWNVLATYPWHCRGQGLTLVISLTQSTATNKTFLYNFRGLLADIRPKTPPHNQPRYCEIQQFAVKIFKLYPYSFF